MKRILMEDIKVNRVLKKSEPEPVEKEEVGKEHQEERNKELARHDDSFEIKSFNQPKTYSKRMSLTPRSKRRNISDQKPLRPFFKNTFFVVLLVGIIFWGGNLFKRAFVTISAKHDLIEYKNKQFNANKDITGKGVSFEIMIESDKKAKDFILTESKEVSNKASGVITLYNEFSTKAEKLVAGTYISDQDGKAYRLNNSVVIPGYKIDKLNKIPGQIDAEITSFLAGESYNGTPEKFYVNSFKGTTKYSKIYGKLKSELQGGMQGLVYYVTESDKEKLQQIAESSFKNDLFNKVKALLPAGYILYQGATSFSYKINDNILSETPETKIEIEGILSAVLIREDSLIKNIIGVSLPDVTKEELEEIGLEGIKDLTFNFSSNTSILKEMTNFDFTLSGNIEAIWTPNKNKLIAKLTGVSKDQVLPIFRQDRGITKASVRIFPPWDKILPNNPSKININIQ